MTRDYNGHDLASRLEGFLERGRLLIEKPKDQAEISKWQAQTQALLRDALGNHPYTTRLEHALAQPAPTNLIVAYGVLWAVYEDAMKGVIKPARESKRR